MSARVKAPASFVEVVERRSEGVVEARRERRFEVRMFSSWAKGRYLFAAFSSVETLLSGVASWGEG